MKIKLLYFFSSVLLGYIAGCCVMSPSLYAQDEEQAQGVTQSEQETVRETEGDTARSSPVSVLEIQPADKDDSLFSIELKDADIRDVFRVLAHDYNLNILIDKDVRGTLTASLTVISLKEALEVIAELNNLRLEKKENVIVVKPNFIRKTFILHYANAQELLRGSRSGEMAGEDTGGTAGSTASEHTIYDLLSSEGKVLLGKQPNSIMVIDYPQNLEKIQLYVEMLDKGMTSKMFRLKYIKAKDIVGAAQSSDEGGQPGVETSGDVGDTSL